MQERGWYLGAENSGHVVILDKTTTGDGIIASLQVLAAIVRNKSSLYQLCEGIKMFPQVLINVASDKKYNLLEEKSLQKKIIEGRKLLAENGRIVLRESGTEPLIRIMVEGKNLTKVTRVANNIASSIESNRRRL
jgi:phosphoglucosamine mutase